MKIYGLRSIVKNKGHRLYRLRCLLKLKDWELGFHYSQIFFSVKGVSKTLFTKWL